MYNSETETKTDDFKDVTHTLRSESCTGCGACAQLCPTAALQIKTDKEGFLKPVLSPESCTNCGLCTQQCVALHPSYKNNSDPECFAVMASDDIRMLSSSGGFFTVAAEKILSDKGYVCGAVYTTDLMVEHKVTSIGDDLEKLRGSKYIQSNASVSFSEIKGLLSKGKKVLFTGLPCQVAGLYAYLKKDYENLITIDLLCHGITSHKVFAKYKKDVLGPKQIDRLYFKSKKPWGWKPGINAFFEDGTKYSCIYYHEPFFDSYLHSLCKGTACEECKQNKLPRQGDMSIGDFWGVEKVDPALNDNKGTSVVLVNNKKGKDFFESVRDDFKVVRETPLKAAIERNHCIEYPYKNNKSRHDFFKTLDYYDYSDLTQAFLDNKLFELKYINLVKTVPEEDHEYYYIAKTVADNYEGRKVVTWIRSSKFERILKQYFDIDVHVGVSMRNETLKKDYIEPFSMLKGKKSDYYLVSLDRVYDPGIYKTLSEYGYTEKKDFVFRFFKPIVLNGYDLSKGNYYDDYGNSVEGFRNVMGKVVLRGFNNHIMLGNNINSAENISFDLCANSVIKIDDGCNFNGECTVEVKGYNHRAHLRIGKKCIFNQGVLFRFYNSEGDTSILINDNCTSSSKLGMHVNQGKRIIVGKDCMFSFENELWAGDGHTIFDVTDGKNINGNLNNSFSPKNQLVLGDHVWVGKQAFLLHGTNVGSGSIVGARAMVSKEFPNNCTITGNPAKVSKENIAWSRHGMTTNIKTCGSMDYVRQSSKAKAPVSGRKVLVIGGTRFMGKHLVRRLLELGNDVYIATRGNKADDFGMFVNRIKMDVSSEESVKAALRGKHFDIVFDNLAYCSLYTKNVLTYLDCEKYIQLSSMEAYVNMKIDMKEEYFDPFNIDVEIVDRHAGYVKGKRMAEAVAYKMIGKKATTVRLPFVTKTERLQYYCDNIFNQTPMNIDDVSRGFTFVRDSEVGSFLPWIAAQNYSGPVNFASEGMVTIKMILEYIEKKMDKKAVIDTVKGSESPFHVFNEKTLSLNVDKLKKMGYQTSNLHDWFWSHLDEYIKQALNK